MWSWSLSVSIARQRLCKHIPASHAVPRAGVLGASSVRHPPAGVWRVGRHVGEAHAVGHLVPALALGHPGVPAAAPHLARHR